MATQTEESLKFVPLDVERLIVEALFIPSLDSGALANFLPIVYVCRRFKDWAYPHIYHSVVLQSQEGVRLLRRTLFRSPEIGSLIQSLSLVAIPGRTLRVRSDSDALDLVASCPKLRSLLYFPGRADRLLDISNNPLLRTLCFDPRDHLVPNTVGPPFALGGVTHLDLSGSMQSSLWLKMIRPLDHLTHLCLSTFTLMPTARTIAELPALLPTSLYVCVLQYLAKSSTTGSNWAQARLVGSGQFDHRIVVALSFHKEPRPFPYPYVLRATSPAADSLPDAIRRIKPDFWEEAEAIIRERYDESAPKTPRRGVLKLRKAHRTASASPEWTA